MNKEQLLNELYQLETLTDLVKNDYKMGKGIAKLVSNLIDKIEAEEQLHV